MSLSRDELAARFAVAAYGGLNSIEGSGGIAYDIVASNAVQMADAFLSALAPKHDEAPPPAATPAYPVDAAGPVKVGARVTIPSFTPGMPEELTGVVERFNGDCAVVRLDDGAIYYRANRRKADAGEGRDYVEPCAAPTDAVTPAAALTEEEREGLASEVCDAYENECATYDGLRDRYRVAWRRAAAAAAAWFQRRGGAK